MSYKHLAGRLIETQRSMLGEPALEIARSVDGLSVEGDGTVTAVDGDGRAVVDDLANRYVEVLGDPAENRLVAAAREFEAELTLPPTLGGPDIDDAAVDEPHDEPPAEATHLDQEPAGSVVGPQVTDAPAAVSDGGTVGPSSGGGTATEVVSPTPGYGPGALERPDDATDAGADADAAKDTSGLRVTDPVTFEYTLASTLEDAGRPTLEEVYLMPADGDEWQPPVTVASAVVDAVARAADTPRETLPDCLAEVDADRVVSTLAGENGDTVSFRVEELTVTVHRSGSIAVH
jgi:hypothetical protein